jgi:hypothetical protein
MKSLRRRDLVGAGANGASNIAETLLVEDSRQF